MLLHRVFAATLFVIVFIAAMCADYWTGTSLALHGVFLIVTFLCFLEFWPMCRATGLQTFSKWGTLSGCLLVCVHFWTLHIVSENQSFETLHRADLIMNGAMVIAVLGAFVLTASRQNFQASLGGLGVTCLGMIYIWFMPSFVLKLRHLGTDGMTGGKDWEHFGSKMVIATIVVAKGCDVAAYLIGRWKGKHKAFPILSPGKTIEGLVAGLAGSSLLALLLTHEYVAVLPREKFGVFQALIFGLLVGLSGMMGDLAESILKRSAGVKDSSHMVPGYGGMMDVIDSLVVAGPVAYFLVPILI